MIRQQTHQTARLGVGDHAVQPVGVVRMAADEGNAEECVQPEGFHQAARYIVVPGVHQPTFLWEVVVKQETWNAVPDDLKAKLEMAAQLTTYQGLSHFLAEDMKAMAQYRAGRNEVITLEPDFIKQLANAGRDWIAKKAEEQNGKGNARLAETLADYNAFKAQWDAETDYLIRD